MNFWTVRLIAGLMLTLAGAMQHGCTQSSRLLKDRIPKPDPQKYSSIQSASDWKNPYLIVGPDGVGIVGITSAGRGISVDSVPDALERLPDSAWPYGLVVGVQDVGIASSSGDKPRIEANRTGLLRLLRQHGIAAELWPSA